MNDFGFALLGFERTELLGNAQILSVNLHIKIKNAHGSDYAESSSVNFINFGTGGGNGYDHAVYFDSNTDDFESITLREYYQRYIRGKDYSYIGTLDYSEIIPLQTTEYEFVQSISGNVNVKGTGIIWARVASGKYVGYYGDNTDAAAATSWRSTNKWLKKNIDIANTYIEVVYNADPTVTSTSPNNSGFVEDEPIPFTWSYNSPISEPQASATIEYKLASASTWTTATSSGTSTTWTLSAGLPAGSYQWRVKAADGNGNTSAYSAVKSFTVAEQAAPTPTYPVDTGLPAYAPIAFAWTFNKPSSASAATQASATLQYRERGSNIWIEEEITGTSTTWTLSAGLSVGQYEWHVKIENNFGNESSYSNIKYFQIVAQSAPTPTSPGDNITLFEGHDITFTWLYNSLTPATQASATIKYRVRGGSTWTTYTSASSNPYCTISDIPQGQYEWCLNITNNYGETSADSSTLEFNIIGRPQKPIILEPANCCLTTISWNAEGQEAAEFILMDGDDNILIHETVATAVTSYKPQMFLKGSYKAMARIKNNSDLWSDYGELEFTIDAAAPDAGVLVAIPYDTEIHLEGTYTSENAAIVRIDEDGTENVLSMTASAVDKKVASGLEYAYVLRCWNSGGYVDTPTKVFTFNFPGSIFTTDTEELHLDRSEQKFIAHDEDVERQYAAMRYVGREYAVIERGEYTEQTLAKQFHVTKAQRRILDRLAKEKALFYRDSRGNAFKAAILGVSYNGYMDDAYIASIKLTRTAADEVIINV